MFLRDSGTNKGNLSVSGRPLTAQCLTPSLPRIGRRRNGSRHPTTSHRRGCAVDEYLDIACAVDGTGHDHRTALITKAHKSVMVFHIVSVLSRYSGGFPRRPGSRPPGRGPTQDHLQLITLPSSALATAPSYGAESVIETSVSANGASPPDSQFEPIQKPSTRSVVQPLATSRL